MRRLIWTVIAVGLFCGDVERLTAQEQKPPKPKQLAALAREVKQLVRRYYPDATVSLNSDNKRGTETVHFEFSTYPILMRYRDQNGDWQDPQWVRGPYVGGIWCDMTLEKGRYAGKVAGAEEGVTETGPDFYTHLIAPYSKKLDRNMTVQLRFPGGTAPEFMRQFSALVKDFETYVGKPVDEQTGTADR